LNLAYIIGTYPLLTTTFIDREVETLRQMGMNIQLLSIRRPPPHVNLTAKYGEMQQSIIYLLPVNRAQFILAHLYFALLHPLTYFTLLAFLFTQPHPNFKLRLKTLLHFAEGVYAAYLLRGRAWDHLHAHFVDRAATVALCVGRLLGASYSLTAHANDIYTQQVLIGEKIAGSKFTVTVSEFNKAYLLENYPELDRDKIYVLHPWVDMSGFQPPPVRSKQAVLRILSVGRLVEKKGHQYLIEACHLLKLEGVNFECRIIGDGPLTHELQQDIERHNLQGWVELLGARPQSEVLRNLAWCDVFVLACVIAKDGDRDGMPVALAEAMAMAVPVISCRIVGIDELVRPAAGVLVPPRDGAALAQALQTISALNESDRHKMGQCGREIVDTDFNLHKGIRQLMFLFQNICRSAVSA
jgi:glycosyltransferase involved in cell wall biosynthesis